MNYKIYIILLKKKKKNKFMFTHVSRSILYATYIYNTHISCVLFYFSNSLSKNPFITRSFLALLQLLQFQPEQSILLKHRGSNQNQGYYFVTFIKVFLGKKSLSLKDLRRLRWQQQVKYVQGSPCVRVVGRINNKGFRWKK